ncbi:transcription factor YdeB [Bacillus wiedmannii]|uniref:CarD family transcriptional regulator n=11 Tax=Bacillus cereus group TaxID=86661 RepID=A0A0J6ZX43_BACCE|nr:CarD family transcriptional regulator [Bacillus thuringiensis HD-789]AND24431.1 transcription factor YdeB [Bacillus thuringiensis serovar israelensis]EEM98775.1 Transcriptional regulator, CarD [Bacillus thuringiensis IBL 4222]KAA0799473.1 CarD family transcriptional regulator [Bacillus sp. BB56-3]KAA8483721.1 CarD family transcriptional regulator [Bacillus thuringiensis]KAB2499691.1 CarD family transcriptional regulator [Bacillus cereus]KMP24434.1 transcription factor YdeB [Bacillus wiedma
MEVDYMFQIGDNIVYPMHGAGIIEAIEEKEFSGKKQQYYVIKMSIRNMQVMIPTGKILSSSIRPVTDILALKHIIHIFQHGESDRLLPWKQRHKVNTDKIKTGEIQEGAEVVRDLMRMKKEKALNTSDKKMLDNAHEFLISELGLIKGITENQIKSFC